MKTLMLFFVAVLLMQAWGYAQGNIQKEIDEQVWKPFVAAFNSFNQEEFAAVHSKDIIRVIQDDKIIWGYNQYFPEPKKDGQTQTPNHKRTLELRFIQRIADNDKAFEVGYYKTSYQMQDGSQRSGYGKFHVVLRKEEGKWKILVDADTNQGASKEEFEKASPIG